MRIPKRTYRDVMTAFRVSVRSSKRMSREMSLINGLISHASRSGKVRLNVTDSF